MAIFGVRSAYMAVRSAMSTLSQYDEQMATNVEYIRLACRYDGLDTTQIEEGSTATTYEPYSLAFRTDGEQKLTISGKNIWNLGDFIKIKCVISLI